jgi:hypothetical protein
MSIELPRFSITCLHCDYTTISHREADQHEDETEHAMVYSRG